MVTGPPFPLQHKNMVSLLLIFCTEMLRKLSSK
uniref:Uncharacterized protein n=1 Tax=Anguilla anguilla TaxID=7936 RepID=A0A0E9PYQ3_ANGAN